MDMQDKEFDELFRSKLDGLEAEPSASVWPGIADGLNLAKRRNILLPFLSIAATIIVLVTAGLLFIPKKTPIKIEKTIQNNIVKKLNPSVVPSAGSNALTTITKVKIRDIRAMAKLPVEKTRGNIAIKSVDTATKQAISPKTRQQPVMAIVTQKQTPAKPVVPDTPIQLAVKAAIDQQPAFTNKPAIAATLTPAIKRDSAAVKTRHGIHTLGDLVNVLIAKVDKRKDKVIQFSDNDDGGSSITGVNLGIIKIKKGE